MNQENIPVIEGKLQHADDIQRRVGPIYPKTGPTQPITKQEIPREVIEKEVARWIKAKTALIAADIAARWLQEEEDEKKK